MLIPLDQESSKYLALRNWDSFIVWNCLIFEVVILCRMKKYLRIYPLHSTLFLILGLGKKTCGISSWRKEVFQVHNCATRFAKKTHLNAHLKQLIKNRIFSLVIFVMQAFCFFLQKTKRKLNRTERNTRSTWEALDL